MSQIEKESAKETKNTSVNVEQEFCVTISPKKSISPAKPFSILGLVKELPKNTGKNGLNSKDSLLVNKKPVVVKEDLHTSNETQNLNISNCNMKEELMNVDDEDVDQEMSDQWILRETDGEVSYECRWCAHSSLHLSYMKRHCLIHNGGEIMKCEDCDFSTMWRNEFRAHRKQHAPAGYLCDVCSQTFKTRYSLKRHNARKHGGKANFACQMCDFVSVNSVNLRDHMRKHTGNALKCDQCSFTTNFERALSLHKARHQGVTRFVCEVCGYKTLESSSFKRHILIHSGKKLFKCPDCSYTAASRYVVVKHIYGKHIDYKRYACKKCDFKTAYYSGLSMHLMSHEGVKPYQCSICTYRSNLSNKVKRHCAQKHLDEEAATVVKVENCLKFDARDYANPDVPHIEVKVIRLEENGAVAEEVTENVEDNFDAVSSPTTIQSDIGTEGLMCESPMPVTSSPALEDMSMMDEGFGLCNDPPLALTSQNYHGEDSNLFMPRGRSDSASSNQRLRFQAADESGDNIMSEFSHTPFKSNPFGGIGLGMRSESWDNLTLIRPNSFGNIGLGSRSESWDNLTQIKPSLFKQFDQRDLLTSLKATDLETSSDHTKDHTDETSSVPSNPVYQVDPFQEIPIADTPSSSGDSSTPRSVKDKALCSLMSPEVVRHQQPPGLNSSSKP